MREVNKVAASAGAEWLLGGFGLLRRAPFGLGLLGVVYGALALLVSLAAEHDMTLFLVLQLVLVLIGPLLLGGFVFAARKVDEGGHASPAQFLESLQGTRPRRLLATLLPQVVAMLVCIALLLALIGPSELVQMAQTVEQMKAQAKPDPALLASLPMGRLMAWLGLVFLVGILASFFTFAAVPDIMFSEDGAWVAMQRSFRACLRNLGAMIVFLVLTVIAVMVVYFAVLIVAALVKLVAGATAMQVAVQLLTMAVFMPVITGAMYFAWRQMLAAGDAAAVPATTGFEA